jgi:kanamycin kinase
VNELGGITFAFAAAGQFVKWAPHHPELDLAGEAERMRWAGRFIAVPEVLEVGADAAGQWLRTVALPGRSAVDPHWEVRPRLAARAIGSGLRQLHDCLPVARCPYAWTVEARVSRLATADARWFLDHAPALDRLVVAHGDACAPNTLLDEHGRPVGHVDLGRLGLADRWADLAVATYSLAWNYDGDWEGELLDAYGIARDEARIAFYRRLWDAT